MYIINKSNNFMLDKNSEFVSD